MTVPDFFAELWEAIDDRLPFAGATDFEAALEEIFANFDPAKEKARISLSLRAAVPANRHCAMCPGILTRRLGRYGHFYGCTNYPPCRYTKNKLN